MCTFFWQTPIIFVTALGLNIHHAHLNISQFIKFSDPWKHDKKYIVYIQQLIKDMKINRKKY